MGVGLDGAFVGAIAVAEGGCPVSVGFCWLADVVVGVDDAINASLGTGVALGAIGMAWVEAGWPAGAFVRDAWWVGAAVEVV